MPRSLQIAQTLWGWFAQLSGLAIVAGAVGWLLAWSFSHNGPVVVAGPTRVVNANGEVKIGGTLTFEVQWYERFESCPGVVVESYFNLEGPSAAVVTRRPALSFAVKRYGMQADGAGRPVPVNVELPQQLTPGRWRYTQTVESRECPSGRTGPDLFTSFEFTVIPG